MRNISNVPNLILSADLAMGETSHLIVGTEGDDDLRGGSGNETILGLGGDDTLHGGSGNDSLDGGEGSDRLVGGLGGDILAGGDGDDDLRGGQGDDVLRGAKGDDMFAGGEGSDTADFWNEHLKHGVQVDLRIQDVAQDTGQGLDTLSSIENVRGTVFADVIHGDKGANFIVGDGSFGLVGDRLFGHGGDDVFAGSALASRTAVDGGKGIDTLEFDSFRTEFHGANFDLSNTTDYQDQGGGVLVKATGVEDLSGSIYGDQFIGDDAGNRLYGGEGNDTLGGGAGNDFLSGDERVYGSGAVVDQASHGADQLDGGQGDDTLYGGGGGDSLTGGEGADVFVFRSVAEMSGVHILDLEQIDTIDLSAIDADITADGDQAFVLVASFTGAAGELVVHYSSQHNETSFQADTDGDGVLNLSITVEGDYSGFTNFAL